jgi:C1A family cysteine protease
MQMDYRNHTCMQPVKNQGRCGSCSAFAATAVVEFVQCIKTGTPVNLRLNQMESIQLETIILFDNYITQRAANR